MATVDEQIKSLEEEISKTKYNKATQGHIGKLKAKIAALRQKQEKAAAHSRSSGGNQGFEVKKSGDASVALVGFPSVGKSSLISQLTDVESEAGNFAFTTLTCIPGVMDHRGAKIQILDLPGLIKGASDGKGRGKEILNVIRGSDMVLYVIDPFQKSHFKILDDELWKAGMRLNQSPPQVFVSRTRRGGIEVRSTLEQTNMSDEEIQGIIRGFGIVSATVTLRTDVTDDHIVDTLAGNRIYSRSVVVVNKIDLANEEDLRRAYDGLPEGWPVLNVSAKTGEGLDALKERINALAAADERTYEVRLDVREGRAIAALEAAAEVAEKRLEEETLVFKVECHPRVLAEVRSRLINAGALAVEEQPGG